MGYPVPGRTEYTDLAFQVGGSLKNSDKNIRSWVPCDSDQRKSLAMPSNDWKLQTRPFVKEGTPQQTSLKIIKK
jgi:hypothetical protein